MVLLNFYSLYLYLGGTCLSNNLGLFFLMLSDRVSLPLDYKPHKSGGTSSSLSGYCSLYCPGLHMQAPWAWAVITHWSTGALKEVSADKLAPVALFSVCNSESTTDFSYLTAEIPSLSQTQLCKKPIAGPEDVRGQSISIWKKQKREKEERKKPSCQRRIMYKLHI